MRPDTRFAGVDFTLRYSVGAQAGSNASSSAAAGVGYTAGNLSVAAYTRQMKNLAGNETRKILGAGGNYKVNLTLAHFGGVMQRTSVVSPQKNTKGSQTGAVFGMRHRF